MRVLLLVFTSIQKKYWKMDNKEVSSYIKFELNDK